MQAPRYTVLPFKARALFLTFCFSLLACAVLAQPPSGEALLSGSVVDGSAKPAGGAQVFATLRDAERSFRVTADVAGAFLFRALEPGSYTIYAAKDGVESVRSTLMVVKDAQENVRIVLNVVGKAPAAGAAAISAQGSESMDFVDKPNFTVAGVTDWTAVGGHGSDATLRTSEELNREALALRAGAPAAATSIGARTANAGPDTEAKLRATVTSFPFYYVANRDLGLFYLDEAEFTQALPLMQAAVRLSGGAAEDEYHLALALQGKGDFNGAERHVGQALAHEDAGDFRRLDGELDEKLGDPLAAVREEQRATQLDPSEVNYFTWGSELLRHRAIWQAAEVFANGAKAYPASIRMKTAWAAALFASARYDEAAQKVCEASDLDPSAREPYVFAGKIALASPSTAGCVPQKLERFLALRPDDADANYLNAMFLLKQGTASEQERVQQLLRKAVMLDPKCSDAYLQLGIMSAARKDYTRAIADYKRALEADPQKGEAHYRLGIAYDRTGDTAKARAEYRLHEQIDASNAALVEQQRREVKQFSIVTNGSPGSPAAQ